MSLRSVFRRKASPLTIFACTLALALSSVPAWSAQDSAQTSPIATPRIVEKLDEARLTALKGNTRPEARAKYDQGRVSPNLPMGDLLLVLKRGPEQQSAFDTYLASQQDKSSPNYHHWLTPDQIGQKFGPAQADIDVVTNWLQNHGFKVTGISKDRMAISFDGLTGQVEGGFHTEIHNLQVRGENHIANMSDPSIPEALTPVVVGVKALHNFFARPLHRMGAAVRRTSQGGWERIDAAPGTSSRTVAPAFNAKSVHPLFGTGGTPAQVEDVAPYDFATIYNVLPLWNASTPINGAGQTIAIAGTSNINLTDVKTFRSAFGLPAYTSSNAPQVILANNVDPGDCPTFATTCQGDLEENTLDVEWAGAIAPAAQIVLVTSGVVNSTTDTLFTSEQYIVDNVTANVMNVSYGECELGLGVAGNQAYNDLWSKAQMAGIAVFVATGDSGSATCDAGFDQQVPYGAQFGLSVSGIASTPFNTAVGGTDFNWGWVTNGDTKYWGSSNSSSTKANALGYIPESPWNSSCANSLFVANVDDQLSKSLTAGEVCDEFGTGQITSGGQPVYGLVDTVGGSGGASSCIDGDQQNVSSCSKGYAKPSWQTGVPGIPNDKVRDIPDVSFFSSSGFSGSAYVICVSAAGTCSYTQGTEPSSQEVGGTSVATPIMAAVMALINQKSGSPQGNPNTELYQLAHKETYSGCSTESIPLTGSSCIFNDIDTGTIAMPCDVGSTDCAVTDEVEFSILSGYDSTTGYDLATGLGSMNVANLVTAFAATAIPAPAVTLTPKPLTFASTVVGIAATAQTITLKNTGNADLTVTTVTVGGTNATSFSETDTCAGKTVASGSTCAITVTFKPTTAGALTGSIIIADNAIGAPHTVNLTGTGTAATTPTGTIALTSNPATLSLNSGATTGNTATVTVTPSGGYAGTVNLTCSVAPAQAGANDPATCSLAASSVAANSATTPTVVVTVKTTAATTALNHTKKFFWPSTGGAVLALVAFFGIPARRRKWQSILGVVVFMTGLGVLSGCGGGSKPPITQPIPGTTAGTYTVTIAGVDSVVSTIKSSATITVTVK